ncbi:unnamed protein product, partial [marine sediment metagenome]
MPQRIWKDQQTATACEQRARGMFPDKDFDFTDLDPQATNDMMREFCKLSDEYPEVSNDFKYIGTYTDKKKMTPRSSGYMNRASTITDWLGGEKGGYAHHWGGRQIGLNPY